ncbi:hypothetical protein PHLGIDRAFT_33877 [Phlebiopsis gigantea 11061_1 CR5-6]|uniref:Uncharacterized protein n=1 Tax=Phlebiopsis gigantea (strain 11061_1 CR5-6) TaxID=745531 RepID=A0A0C3NYH1_PHLG1|nr:hypothetical protein PHLGIDRAFT_33877 [Phlebiopsis gigantea 11061_1 CR5-6]
MATQNALSTSRGSTPAQIDELDNVQRLSETTPGPTEREVGFTDDANWEDEPGYNLANPHEKSPPPIGSSPRSVRRRKATGRKVFVAQPNPTRKTKTKGNISENSAPLVNINKEQLKGALNHGASHGASYLLGIVKDALWLLRKPLSAILFVYILAYLLALTSSAFRAVVAPLCWVPGIASTPMCYTPPKIPRFADYPKLAEIQGATFEQLLDETVGGSGLSLEIKKAEMATSDLVTLVKVSKFKSKDLLAQHLEGFVDAAKKTSRGLQRFSSRVSGAVDNIIAVNDHALHTIEEHTKPDSVLSYLNPFSNALTTREVVTRTFTEAMSVLATQMQRVVLEAEVSVRNLDHLEEMLVTVHEMASRENADITAAKEELLAQLWTILGGNRKELRGMDGHLYLLRHIGEYRARAMAHVVAALQAVTAMSEDMEDLRERVSAPELVGDKIPVEVHMKAIRAGLERLKEDRIKAQKREEDTYKRIAGIQDDDS